MTFFVRKSKTNAAVTIFCKSITNISYKSLATFLKISKIIAVRH